MTANRAGPRDPAQQIIAAGRLHAPPSGLRLVNFLHPAVPRLRARRRGGPVTEVILHETVTTSVATTLRVLERRSLGVHFIVGPDGAVTQHGDCTLDRMAHAGRHNLPSVGIEVVNPYYPKYLRSAHPWQQVIDAPWAHKKQYVVPSKAQAEATAQLVAWLTQGNGGLLIPRRWIGLKKSRLAMGRVLSAKFRKPGIYAHTYFGHADGPWLILYAWLRLEAGLAPEAAYDEATRRATGARRRVDLSDLLTSGAPHLGASGAAASMSESSQAMSELRSRPGGRAKANLSPRKE